MVTVRKTLRRMKAHCLRFRREHRPIILFALRRGGSTMLADALAVVPGVWFANEPFAVLPSHPGLSVKQSMLPAAEHSHFFNLDGAELSQFDRYLDLLLKAGSAELGSCRRTLRPLRANRALLKVLNAPWMIDHISNTTDAHILILLRHPAAQALSTLRQGWGWPQEAYYRRLDEIAHYFTQGNRI